MLLRVPDQHEAAAADAATGRSHNGQRERRGNRRIDHIAAALQDLESRRTGSRMVSSDNAVLKRPGLLFRVLRGRGTPRQNYEHAQQRRAAIHMGFEPAFQKRQERRFNAPDNTACQTEEEAALLLDPDARLSPQGVYITRRTTS